jgi:hypothetical protein
MTIQNIEHNTKPWRVATNRHTNIDGTSWGWIDGAPGHVCWSDDSRPGRGLNREQAGKLVAEHNEWLERQRPIDLRLVEAVAKAKEAEAYVVRKQAEADRARSAHTDAMIVVAALREEQARTAIQPST